MSFEAVIFDLDGTLLNTLEDIAESMNRILIRHGYKVHELYKYRKFIGDGADMLVERALPDNKNNAEKIKLLAEFREEYDRNMDVKTRPYDGISELLGDLTARTKKLAVLSNKPHAATERCVNDFFPGHFFEIVLGQKDEIPKKPDPTGALLVAEYMKVSPEQILYIGDTGIDMRTGVSAGMCPVGAIWGYRDEKELRDNGARFLISKPGEILDLL